MRGAVSVALVYYYYDPDGQTSDRQRSTLIAMTLTVVLFSTIIFGAITKPMLDLMLGARGVFPSQMLAITPQEWQLCLQAGHQACVRDSMQSCRQDAVWTAPLLASDASLQGNRTFP